MFFTLQRGVIGQENRKTDGKTFAIDGEEYDRCPFCMTLVPLQAEICTGCGAKRNGPIENWIGNNWGWVILAMIVLLIIWIIIVPYL